MISVVVPVHDEERSVALLYDELRSGARAAGDAWEAIFVDDGSTDGTFGALTRLHNAEQNVRVVRLRRNFGKAAALVAGFDQARGETVVTIDGDLPGRSRRDPAAAREAGRGLRPRLGLEDEAARPAHAARPVADLQPRHGGSPASACTT